MRGRLLSWGGNLAIAMVSVALTLLGFELALRLFLPQKLYRFPPGLFRSDPDLAFALTPGFQATLANPEYTTQVRVGTLGLRGADPGPKTPGTFRVLGLGDSFVSAFNMEESKTFLAVAETTIRKTLPTRAVEVINAGTPNYGTWHELRMLRRLAPRLSPDAVVLCVYVGNDVQDNLTPRRTVVTDGYLAERDHSAGILPYRVRSWLQRSSMAYVFLWNAWNEIRPWFGRVRSDPLGGDKDLASPDAPAYIDDGYRVTGDLLRQLRDEVGARGIPALVVLIPTELQVYPDRFERAVRRQGGDPQRYDLTLPSRRWADLAHAAGLSVLDLLPIFRAHASGPYLYMTLDGHLTEEGNHLAGEAIAGALVPVLAAGERGGRG